MRRPTVRISKSSRQGKKMMAVFSYPDGREKTVHFGCAVCGDYVRWSKVDRSLGDRKRRAYIARHGTLKSRENWSDLESPGALSRWILWEKRTLPSAIAAYRRRMTSAR